MFETFTEYMYYLLTTPFKKVKKTVNQWYILFKVLGRWFDECKEDLFKAREESMIATCNDITLPIHAEDRGLSQYEGESNDNFRVRIAMYEEICRLGGNNEGIILVVKALGYENPMIVRAVDFCGDESRWAEFYLIVDMNVDAQHPIALEILKDTVRRTKEVSAKDNYYFKYGTECRLEITNEIHMIKRFESTIEIEPICGKIHKFKVEQSIENRVEIVKRNDLHYFNGEYRFNGEIKFNSFETREEL